MFKVGDRVVKKDGSEWSFGEYRTVRIADEYGYIMLQWDDKIYCEEELKLYQEENRMEKTFREVIAIIKEGEVWENTMDFYDIKSVELSEGYIRIEKGDKGQTLTTSDNIKFKLKRKEYSFEEAFKAYEEGKKVESISFKYKKYKETDGFIDEDGYWKAFSEMSFDLSEIRGKWYIND